MRLQFRTEEVLSPTLVLVALGYRTGSWHLIEVGVHACSGVFCGLVPARRLPPNRIAETVKIALYFETIHACNRLRSKLPPKCFPALVPIDPTGIGRAQAETAYHGAAGLGCSPFRNTGGDHQDEGAVSAM